MLWNCTQRMQCHPLSASETTWYNYCHLLAASKRCQRHTLAASKPRPAYYTLSEHSVLYFFCVKTSINHFGVINVWNLFLFRMWLYEIQGNSAVVKAFQRDKDSGLACLHQGKVKFNFFVKNINLECYF